MSSRVEKAQKQVKEKFQAILNELLREDANRYCADCEAKGPRWSSWNIGVFMCIRCAGIHRNLGVHISRVKSVNLDSWTREQIENIQNWGNKRASEYYECYLPEDFARPQGDSAMETFIRNKYERKLYMRKGGVPPASTGKVVQKEKEKENKTPVTKRKTPEKSPQQSTILDATKNQQSKAQVPQQPTSLVVPRPHANGSHSPKRANEAPPLVDLLMDAPTTSSAQATQSAPETQDDEFNLFMSAPVPVSSQQTPAQQNTPLQPITNNDPILFEESPTVPAKTTKESILSLYKSGNQQQQRMFGVPGGMYVSQQQQQQQQQQQPPPPHQQQQQQQLGNPTMGMGQAQYGMQQQQQQQLQMQQMMQLQQQMQQMQFRQGVGNQMQMNQMNQMRMTGQSTYGPAMQAGMQAGNFGPMQSQNATGGFTGLMGQNYMANNSWGANRPMLSSQQPIMANGSGTGYNTAPLATSPTSGHTLNHQLWN